MNRQTVPAAPADQQVASPASPAAIYLVAFVTGAIVMSFEMLGSRYLNPYFGSGIYTWASLISTVLAALCVGYFIGGNAAAPHPPARPLGARGAIRPGPPGRQPNNTPLRSPLPINTCSSFSSRKKTK